MEDLQPWACFAHQVVESILVDVGDRDPGHVVESDADQLRGIEGTAVVLQKYVQVAAVARVGNDDVGLAVAIDIAHLECVEGRPVARHYRIDVRRAGENAGGDLPQYAEGFVPSLKDDIVPSIGIHISDLDFTKHSGKSIYREK